MVEPIIYVIGLWKFFQLHHHVPLVYLHKQLISEFGVATAHSNDAFCVRIKITITVHSIEMEIYILTQNRSFKCAVATPNSLIGVTGLGHSPERLKNRQV